MSQDTMAAVNGSAVLSPHDRIPFTPDRYKDAGVLPDGVEAPVYQTHPLTRRERRKIAMLTQRRCGDYVADDELCQVIRDEAIALLEPEPAARVCGLVEEYEKISALEEDKLPAELKTRLDELQPLVAHEQKTLSRLSQPLRDALAFRIDWIDTIKEFTARACVVDWAGLGAKCIRKDGLVTETAWLAVPDEDQNDLATHCLSLKEVTKSLEAGSVSP